MVDEKELQKLAESLFDACTIWDHFPYLKRIPHKVAFVTDIDNFILAFSDDPVEQLKKLTWLDAVYSEDQKIVGCFEELSEINDVFPEIGIEIPHIIRILKERRQAPERVRTILADRTEDFYEFFDLFGHWLLNEAHRNETYEKRKEKLEETLNAIHNYIER